VKRLCLRLKMARRWSQSGPLAYIAVKALQRFKV